MAAVVLHLFPSPTVYWSCSSCQSLVTTQREAKATGTGPGLATMTASCGCGMPMQQITSAQYADRFTAVRLRSRR